MVSVLFPANQGGGGVIFFADGDSSGQSPLAEAAARPATPVFTSIFKPRKIRFSTKILILSLDAFRSYKMKAYVHGSYLERHRCSYMSKSARLPLSRASWENTLAKIYYFFRFGD